MKAESVLVITKVGYTCLYIVQYDSPTIIGSTTKIFLCETATYYYYSTEHISVNVHCTHSCDLMSHISNVHLDHSDEKMCAAFYPRDY